MECRCKVCADAWCVDAWSVSMHGVSRKGWMLSRLTPPYPQPNPRTLIPKSSSLSQNLEPRGSVFEVLEPPKPRTPRLRARGFRAGVRGLRAGAVYFKDLTFIFISPLLATLVGTLAAHAELMCRRISSHNCLLTCPKVECWPSN